MRTLKFLIALFFSMIFLSFVILLELLLLPFLWSKRVRNFIDNLTESKVLDFVWRWGEGDDFDC